MLDVVPAPSADPLPDEERKRLSELDPAVLPASKARRYRRMMFMLSIFDDISRRGESVDAIELKEYLEDERKSLIKALVLIKTGVMPLPSVSPSYVAELGAPFSLTRAVICCHLLSSSDKLDQLFKRYEAQGVAIISQVGFLKTCEECFKTLTNNDGEHDPVIEDFISVAGTQLTRRFGGGQVSSPKRGETVSNAAKSIRSDDFNLKTLGLQESPFSGRSMKNPSSNALDLIEEGNEVDEDIDAAPSKKLTMAQAGKLLYKPVVFCLH